MPHIYPQGSVFNTIQDIKNKKMNTQSPKLKIERDSNMELLRIIAMLLVMIVHANFRALPVPTYEEANNEILSSILRFFTESFSIICVNLFINI